MLSENSNFAKIVTDHGFKFIGPKFEHIEKIHNISAKLIAQKIGLPIIPGSEDSLKSFSKAKLVASKIGYPYIGINKQSGGRGIKSCYKRKRFKE